jgi:flagellar biosynthesis/type III secretory pathway protein FliH
MSDLKLEIGEAQIQNAIAVAIAESFTGAKRDALLRDIIRAHMSVKQNSYDKETLLAKTIGQMVRDYAQECIKKEVENAKPMIEKTVREALGPGFEESICRQLRDGLAYRKVKGISVSVSVADNE